MSVKQSEQCDWWDEISKLEKAEIEEGLAEAEREEVFSHEEVMAKYQKWRLK
jgi:predicted transcriptional regulator